MRQAKTLLLLCLLVSLAEASAQQPFSFAWHGFVNPHYYADSRSVVSGREDMMLFFPKPILRDSLGHDINSGWQADMLAITARLGLRIDGPDMLGAKAMAYIEGDFTGATNATINNLRLRHAYIKLDWPHHRLLAGQYWYAMVVHEIMPMTNPLNMGAPFHPYARQPQVRYEYHWQGLEAVAVAQWQLDNASQGLLDGQPTTSTLFARHSLLPEFNAQLRYRTQRLFVGFAINAKTVQPVVTTKTIATTHNLHSSLSYSLFGSLQLEEITLKAQTLLANSLYEGCSLGGYMLLPNADGLTYNALDWHFNTVWLDLERNHGHWRPGLFLGYARRVGSFPTGAILFGRGADLDYLWRIQPRLTYTTLNGLAFTAETEYTHAGYAEPVGNWRLSLSMVYTF